MLDTNVTKILDGSALLGVDSDNGTPGTHGGFVYLKNTTSTDIDIYIGFMAHDVASVMESNNDEHRLLTLKQGEFAFLPWDYTMDITCDAENAAATLEYWLFNRG